MPAERGRGGERQSGRGGEGRVGGGEGRGREGRGRREGRAEALPEKGDCSEDWGRRGERQTGREGRSSSSKALSIQEVGPSQTTHNYHSQHGASESDPLAYSHTHHGIAAAHSCHETSPPSRRRFAAEARAARWARLGPPSCALSSPPVGAACAGAAVGCVNGVSSRLGLSTGWAADAESRPDIGKVAASLEELAAKLGASASPSTLPPRRHRAGTA